MAGLKELHDAGYACGDIKPENSLVYPFGDNKVVLRISDFGKAEKLAPSQSATCKGNLRFCPLEGTISQAGDSYGAGMVMKRTAKLKGHYPNYQKIIGKAGEVLKGLLADDPRGRLLVMNDAVKSLNDIPKN